VYKVHYLQSVEADLMALDRQVRKRVMDKIEKTLAQDPRGLGKPLTGPFTGLWRYRIGDYRVVYKIAEAEILIMIARIGHRRELCRRMTN
jgi:mRNA interferase RelE/StbE